MKPLKVLLALVLVMMIAAVPALAGNEAPVSCTVAMEAIGIEVSPTEIDYGLVLPEATVVSPELTLSNSGNKIVDVAVLGDDATCEGGLWMISSSLLNDDWYQHLIEGLAPAIGIQNMTKNLLPLWSAMEPAATATFETTLRVPTAGCQCASGELVSTSVLLVATATA